MFTFAWDPQKAARNLSKHAVSFDEATSVFLDPLALTFTDEPSSFNEVRERTFGLSERQQLLVVIHTQRNNTTRIISARKATRREKKIYEEG